MIIKVLITIIKTIIIITDRYWKLEIAIDIIFLIVNSLKKILFNSAFECIDVVCCF